jgi:hypothetical protein
MKLDFEMKFDIVDALRALQVSPEIAERGASEIERLRAHNLALEAAISARVEELMPDLRAETERLQKVIKTQGEEIALTRARDEDYQIILERWLNIAENGQYGARTKTPLSKHPLVEETRKALNEEPVVVGIEISLDPIPEIKEPEAGLIIHLLAFADREEVPSGAQHLLRCAAETIERLVTGRTSLTVR